MARRLKYPSICFYCKKIIRKNEGFLQRVNGAWWGHCDSCYKAKKELERLLS